MIFSEIRMITFNGISDYEISPGSYSSLQSLTLLDLYKGLKDVVLMCFGLSESIVLVVVIFTWLAQLFFNQSQSRDESATPVYVMDFDHVPQL